MPDKPRRGEERPARTLAWMAALALVGAPLAGYLWETLHQLLAVEVDTRRVLISVPVLFLFAGLLVFAAKVLRGPEPRSGNAGAGRQHRGKEAP